MTHCQDRSLWISFYINIWIYWWNENTLCCPFPVSQEQVTVGNHAMTQTKCCLFPQSKIPHSMLSSPPFRTTVVLFYNLASSWKPLLITKRCLQTLLGIVNLNHVLYFHKSAGLSHVCSTFFWGGHFLSVSEMKCCCFVCVSCWFLTDTCDWNSARV